METSHTVNEPLDLIRLNLGDSIFVKCRGDRTLTGKLHAYDPHLNMILGDAEEVLTCTVANSETGENQLFKSIRQLPMVFVRGDAVTVVSSQLQNTY
ncbi:uncharacterized protein LOC128884310 [Hylaeus volcanicus]|uniref:uncharacterized protein LOC128884310 n=1 Tax=Hylaeus volcanicus TaxID=313075 RepID=UPI0023B86A8B|nr:uncharacterized protein LOC128884310 [Hylaeus volcanicus]